VSKGRIGEDNSGLLGGMIITKIQLAAMERVRIPEENRKDFFLYVDEFQNFVTDAFAGILSEARKYRLNLTVAHQYTAQLVVDKGSAVRDAVFGNVGTMIVFRVGSDDADFLEKEFDPEFTPQDIVNLPNYKVYLKLMIDGVTSRPFSAKTLPPLVKSGNREIEEIVIKSSRELYCKSKEEVEREINDWSGMSLGGDVDSNSSGLEKYPVICSLCHLEKTVPFKPEPGRPVYCKECIAKIKSGEVKVEKGSENQIKHDESKFYKPLADLGIEFVQKDKNENNKIKQENGIKNNVPESNKKENGALKEALNKVLAEKTEIKDSMVTKPNQNIAKSTEEKVAPVEPITLDTLKNKIKEVVPQKDRAATQSEMNKLKELIEKVDKSKEVKSSDDVKKEDKAQVATEPPLTKDNIKEVPEDVLRKILEG
jgi:CxxC-x17-CxxC domain-containing protein